MILISAWSTSGDAGFHFVRNVFSLSTDRSFSRLEEFDTRIEKEKLLSDNKNQVDWLMSPHLDTAPLIQTLVS